jgi:hypothetical protein
MPLMTVSTAVITVLHSAEVLTGDGRVAERWRTGGHERRRLELVARAKESAKELGREGMRCGESRGFHRPFIGAGGSTGEGWLGE